MRRQKNLTEVECAIEQRSFAPDAENARIARCEKWYGLILALVCLVCGSALLYKLVADMIGNVRGLL